MLWVISQFYILLHIVKDIYVWLSVDILHALFSPSWILKENLQKIDEERNNEHQDDHKINKDTPWTQNDLQKKYGA